MKKRNTYAEIFLGTTVETAIIGQPADVTNAVKMA